MAFTIGARSLGNRIQLDGITEERLLEKARRQDFEAFGHIVDAYQTRIFGFVRRMVGTAEEAEDLTQDVFIRAFQNLSKFDGRSALRTWLFRIAYNLCVDASRKRGRTVSLANLGDENEDALAAMVEDPRWNPETIVLDDELREVVENAVGSMSEKLRSVLLLHDKESLSYDEIAETLQIPVGTVKSRLFLARAHVQKCVEGYQS